MRTKVKWKLQDMLDSLSLSSDQRRQVEAVLEKGRPQSEALMREMTPRLRSISDSADAEIRRILTPAQRERLDSMRTGTPTIVMKRVLLGAESLSRTETLTTPPPRP